MYTFLLSASCASSVHLANDTCTPAHAHASYFQHCLVLASTSQNSPYYEESSALLSIVNKKLHRLSHRTYRALTLDLFSFLTQLAKFKACADLTPSMLMARKSNASHRSAGKGIWRITEVTVCRRLVMWCRLDLRNVWNLTCARSNVYSRKCTFEITCATEYVLIIIIRIQ